MGQITCQFSSLRGISICRKTDPQILLMMWAKRCTPYKYFVLLVALTASWIVLKIWSQDWAGTGKLILVNEHNTVWISQS